MSPSASAVADPLKQTTPREPEPTGADPTPRSLLLLTPKGPVCCPLPDRGRVTLGRADAADITVDDDEVSRLHVAIDLGPTVTVTDLGSRNGTRVDGCALSPDTPFPLPPGRAFEFGGTFGVMQARRTARPPDGAESVRDGAPPVPGMRASVVIADPAMKSLHAMVERVARGEINVLLLGETGVGKEVFAERVHQRSPRAGGPLVRLNCAAISESLLESELFGHEKGAFTGAAAARVGLLETAQHGTLFLDEIGELPAGTQVKLLRVLEERRVTPVGGRASRPIDVRVVSATHRDLESDVRDGRFRMDLWFRLNGISLVIPPLRERQGEVPALAALFLTEAAARSRISPAPALSAEALSLLIAWRWPGNLRELRNVMERAALLATDGVILPEHLPDVMRAPPSAPPPRGPSPSVPPSAPRDSSLRGELEAQERQRIVDALAACAGNQTRAAAALGMPRRTLVFKLARYGIARPRGDDQKA